jgi:hypothetical protein
MKRLALRRHPRLGRGWSDDPISTLGRSWGGLSGAGASDAYANVVARPQRSTLVPYSRVPGVEAI